MSASPLMSLGIRAMTANYAALQTTGHNISNANVAGYSRQQVQLATAQGQFTGAGFFGRGVDVATVTRSHNAFLTGESLRASSLASLDGARQERLGSLESLFRTGEAGLGHAVSTFLNTMVDLANRPADPATRQVVLSRASDMAMRFSESGQALDNIQIGVSSDLRTSVTAINQLARGIAASNQQIASLQGRGQPANDLLDKRDRLIAQLSEHLQVSTISASDGTVGVFIAGGQRLVLGTEAAQMAVRADPSDGRRVAVGMVNGPQVNLIDPSSLGGGKVAGLLRFQNTDLVDGRNLIGRLAAEVALAVNQQQQRGLNLSGVNSMLAMFSLGTPQALPNSNNARDASGVIRGNVRLSYTGEPGTLKASDYDLREDRANPGSWVVTRMIGGQLSTDPADRQSFTGTATRFQGIDIDFSVAPPQPGDRFVLQTVGRAAVDLNAVLSDPRELAAASPLVAAAPAGNAGTAKVGPLTMTTSPMPFPGGTDTLTFQRLSPPQLGPDGVLYDYNVTSSLTPGTAFWNPGQSLVGGNGYRLDISGVPADGDTLVITPTPATAVASNNGNATALLALRDAGLVEGQTIGEGYGQALAEIGALVQSGASTASISAAVADQAEKMRTSQSGVNLDEEAARLIQYQQAYQAAAKMLQVAQSLFDTLLQTTGR